MPPGKVGAIRGSPSPLKPSPATRRWQHFGRQRFIAAFPPAGVWAGVWAGVRAGSTMRSMSDQCRGDRQHREISDTCSTALSSAFVGDSPRGRGQGRAGSTSESDWDRHWRSRQSAWHSGLRAALDHRHRGDNGVRQGRCVVSFLLTCLALYSFFPTPILSRLRHTPVMLLLLLLLRRV